MLGRYQILEYNVEQNGILSEKDTPEKIQLDYRKRDKMGN